MSEALRFYVGLDDLHHAKHFARTCISINRLRRRRSAVPSTEVLIDSGAFTELSTFGAYRHGVAEYAAELRRVAPLVPAIAAVAQDFMCEPFIVKRTGLSVEAHQRLTIERFDALLREGVPMPIMPVLQGFDPSDYAAHLRAYGDRLALGAWVGVGSVCKRNSSPDEVAEVLRWITDRRPDLRLHGFGVKKTALLHPGVRAMLWSADSMAWSFSARKQGRSAHDWREAERFRARVEDISGLAHEPWQPRLPFGAAA